MGDPGTGWPRWGAGPVPSGPMSSFAGPYLAAALLLALAGVAKLRAPGASRIALRTAGLPGSAALVRLLGAVEVVLAAAAVLLGGVLPAVGVAVAYGGFAGFAAVLARRSRSVAPCGCFGASDAPVGPLHVAVNVVLAAASLGAAAAPVGSLAAEAGDTPAAGIPFVGFTLLLTWLLLVTLTALPELLAAGRPTAQAGGAR